MPQIPKVRPDKIDKQTAIEKNVYFDVNTNPTLDALIKFMGTHLRETVYITSVDNKDYLVLPVCLAYPQMDMITVYDAATDEEIIKVGTLEDTVPMFLEHSKPVKEVFGDNASVFLDERNLAYYENEALKFLKEHPNDPIWEDSKVTGTQYYDKIKELITVANDLMDGKITSQNLMDLLPLKKNGTFIENRRIPIFKNGISYGANYYDYVTAGALCLCVITHGSWGYDKGYDLKHRVSPNRARIAITVIETGKKITPLINKDLTLNDIKSKIVYLKQTDIHPGCIYKEKSGTEYLYLGDVNLVHTKPEYSGYYKRPKNWDEYARHEYIRMTKKLKEWYDSEDSIFDFMMKYAMKYEPEEMPLSMRENPRKFTALVDDKFKDYQVNLIGKRHEIFKDDNSLIFIDC